MMVLLWKLRSRYAGTEQYMFFDLFKAFNQGRLHSTVGGGGDLPPDFGSLINAIQSREVNYSH